MNIDLVNNFLLFIRFLMVIKPCPGYIHPDEYFQSPELMAHHVLNLKANVTWEWKEDTPIRNIFHPLLSSGLAFWFLRLIKYLFGIHYSTEMLSTLPRVISLFFIHVTERSFLQMLKHVYRNNGHQFSLFLFRTSFISILFMNRTFSNVFETMLFTVLLSKILINCTAARKVNCIFLLTLGFLIAVGFFTRPTFLIFSFYPILHFVILLTSKSKMLILILNILAILLIGFMLGASIMLTTDYFYYSKNMKSQWPPVTPINFILYNTNVDNVKKHGLHPNYTHFVVNMFALFGPLYLFFVKYAFSKLHLIFTYKQYDLRKEMFNFFMLESREKMRIFLLISSTIPILVLSIIPHQEARFLLPVFVPVMIISSSELYCKDKKWKWILAWLLFNLGSVTWYGFLHQSGVFKSLAYMNNVFLSDTSKQTKHTLIYWHTYMVPQHLLGVSINNNRIKVYDLGGTNYDVVADIIKEIQAKYEKNEVSKSFHVILSFQALYSQVSSQLMM